VVELDFLGLHDSAEGARAAVSGGALQLGVAAFGLVLTFGLARNDKADTIEIRWPSGQIDRLSNVAAATSRRRRSKPNGSGFQGLYLQTLKNQRIACRARRETVASPHPRSHPQEATGCSLPARLGDGRPRLLPALGPRQPPPSLQALRVGGKEEQNIMGR